MKRRSTKLHLALAAITLVSILLSGCSGLPRSYHRAYKYVHPTIAVLKFENKAGSPMKWDLGNGMADMMVNSLVRTDRFTVVERQNLDAILKELDLQYKGITRPEGKLRKQRIINVQYLIKGTVTDFSHTGKGGVGVGSKSVHFRGRGSTAIVSIVVTVIDVESGEILLATTRSSKVRSRGFDIRAAYEGIAFGGQAFSRTALGKATQRAINSAVEEVVDVIGSIPWSPAVIEIEEDRVVLNGGKDRRLKPGMMYFVMQPGEDIYDSETGDFLGVTPGSRIGILGITEIFDKFSYAVVREGEPGEVGSKLVRIRSAKDAVLQPDQ